MSDDQIHKIETQLKRITDALLGDEEMGHVGMVAELKSVKASVELIQLERASEKSQRSGGILVARIAWGTILAICGFVAWASGIFENLRKP